MNIIKTNLYRINRSKNPSLVFSRCARLVIVSVAVACGWNSSALSEELDDKTGKFGVLIMAHGGTPDWNAGVLSAVQPLQDQYIIEVAFGMADAVTIQKTVARLETQGVSRIGIVRLFVSGESWYERTEQICGIRPGAPVRGATAESHAHRKGHGAHGHSMELWRIQTKASFALSKQGLAEAEAMGTVLADRAVSLSKAPNQEDVLILAHGPGDDAENERWIAWIDARAKAVRDSLPFHRVKVMTLREDWAGKREAAEKRIREFVVTTKSGARKAIVIPFRVNGFGPYAEVLKDLEYVSDGQGLIPHTAVTSWIAEQIELLRYGAFQTPVAASSHSTRIHGVHHNHDRGNAPIAVMGDHTHLAGGAMFSYRYMLMNMSGLASHEDSLAKNKLFSQGYSMYAREMEMQMHMFDAMYAPSDKLTLMGMLMYQRNTMDGTMKMESMNGISGGMQMPTQMKHSMQSDGLGDVRLSGLYKVADLGHATVHLNLGLSAPTGSNDEKNDGMPMAYPMQLGSGTWDVLPGVTYNVHTADMSWGAQVGGIIRTGYDNGYSLGHVGQAQAWLAKKWGKALSTSLRINNKYWGATDGEDSCLVMTKLNNPLADGSLQGGFRSELGLGISYNARAGILSGHRIAAEIMFPIHEDFDGIQMERDWSLVLGWQYAF